MSLSDDYGQGVAYLGYGDKPDLTVMGDGIVNGALKHGILTFTSQSARDAKLIGSLAPSAGMVTWMTAEQRLDYYTGSAWIPLTPGAWVPLTLPTGIVAVQGSPAYRLVNGSVQMRGVIGKADSSAFPTNAETLLFTMPSGLYPSGLRYYVQATDWEQNIACRIEISLVGDVKAVVPAAPIGPVWISLDGIEYAL